MIILNRSRSLLGLTAVIALMMTLFSMSSAAAAPAAVVIVGGDFGGADLLPANGDVLSGTFTNVGTFKIAAGDTVFVAPGVPLSVQATLIDIDGTLDGVGAGFAGGASVVNAGSCFPPPNGTVTGNPGAGPGGGGGGTFGCDNDGSGGSGGGHGGAGGDSASYFGGVPLPVFGGATVGDATSVSIDQGSGGGSGSRYSQNFPGSSGAGGNGGAAVSLFGMVELDGSILVDGADGGPGIPPTNFGSSAGGGGAGGGVMLSGDLTLNGLISATGGDGGDPPALPFSSSGGGGGGGRIKMFGCIDSIGQFSTDVSGGAIGADVAVTKATVGAAGTTHDGATAQCVIPVGGVTSFIGGSDSSGSLTILAGVVAAVAVIAAAGGWYTRRRWLDSHS